VRIARRRTRRGETAEPGPGASGSSPPTDREGWWGQNNALTESIDIFDGLTPLPEWILADPAQRTQWALQAVLALADTATQIRWNGAMRHLPSVGVTLAPPSTSPYLVVKQDNNGTTFVIADVELPLSSDLVERRTEVRKRPVGAWAHPTLAEIADNQGIGAAPPDPADHVSDPPF
jgi:hypothetical protein